MSLSSGRVHLELFSLSQLSTCSAGTEGKGLPQATPKPRDTSPATRGQRRKIHVIRGGKEGASLTGKLRAASTEVLKIMLLVLNLLLFSEHFPRAANCSPLFVVQKIEKRINLSLWCSEFNGPPILPFYSFIYINFLYIN